MFELVDAGIDHPRGGAPLLAGAHLKVARGEVAVARPHREGGAAEKGHPQADPDRHRERWQPVTKPVTENPPVKKPDAPAEKPKPELPKRKSKKGDDEP